MPFCTIVIKVAVLLLSATGFVGAHNVVNQFPPDMNVRINHVMNTEWVCNTTVPRRNGFIYSHEQALLRNVQGSNLNYPDDIDCRLLVMVGQGWNILIQFPVGIRLACGTTHDSCDCVKLFDGTTEKDPVLKTLCGHYDPDELSAVETNSSSMLVVFKTDKNCQSSRGFIIQYSAFRRVRDANASDPATSPTYLEHTCSVEEYRCDKHKCIPRSFLCDHIAQCLDKTDEGFTGCTAEDQMRFLLGSIGAKHVLAFLGMFLVLLLIILISCCYYGDPLRGYHILHSELTTDSTKVQPFKPDNKDGMDGVHPVLMPGVEFSTPNKDFCAMPCNRPGTDGIGAHPRRQLIQRSTAGNNKDGFGCRRPAACDNSAQEFLKGQVPYAMDDGQCQSSQSSDPDQLYTLMTSGSHSMLVPMETTGQTDTQKTQRWEECADDERNTGVHSAGDDRMRGGRGAIRCVNQEDYICVPNSVPLDAATAERLNRQGRPSRRPIKVETQKCADDKNMGGWKRHEMDEQCGSKHNDNDDYFVMYPERIAQTTNLSANDCKSTKYGGARKHSKSSRHAALKGHNAMNKCNESNNAKSTNKPYAVMAASNYNALMHPTDEMYVGTKQVLTRSQDLIADDDSYVSTKSAIARRHALDDDCSSSCSTPTSLCSECSQRHAGAQSADSELMCPACFHSLPEVTCPQKL